MAWVSEKVLEAFADVVPKLAALMVRVEKQLDRMERTQLARNEHMDEELKALAAELAKDRDTNRSALKFIMDMASKLEAVGQTIPANFRNQIISLTEELRANSKELADGIASYSTKPADPTPSEPSPSDPVPVSDPVPPVTEPPAVTP